MSINKAVIIERDYKGCYERFALTVKEFSNAFPSCPEPCDEWISYTIRPMVHLTYILAEINSEIWSSFFSDMSLGLPDSDVESNNIATVRLDYMSETLCKEVCKIRKEDNLFLC